MVEQELALGRVPLSFTVNTPEMLQRVAHAQASVALLKASKASNARRRIANELQKRAFSSCPERSI
jgi:hypothetical protein